MQTPENNQHHELLPEGQQTMVQRLRGYIQGLLHPFTTIRNDAVETKELWRIVDGKGQTIRTEERITPADGSPGYIIPFPKKDGIDEEVWDRR